TPRPPGTLRSFALLSIETAAPAHNRKPQQDCTDEPSKVTNRVRYKAEPIAWAVANA
ncbi:MAG: hypothetical protein ACJAY2_003588, partial [Pseudomonadales bacterium]